MSSFLSPVPPFMLSATLNKAYQRFKRGEPGEALPLLEQLVEKAPTYVTPHVLMAWAHEALEEDEKALACWQRAYFLMPNSPAVREGLQRVTDIAPTVPSPAHPAGDEASRSSEGDTPPTEDPAPSAPSEDIMEHLPFDLSEEARAETTDAPAFDDLDRLIGDLENARIEPDPDVEDAPDLDLEPEIEDMVSETLARIYETQEQYAEAAVVYRQLAQQEPARSDEFVEKAVQLERRAAQAE